MTKTTQQGPAEEGPKTSELSEEDAAQRALELTGIIGAPIVIMPRLGCDNPACTCRNGMFDEIVSSICGL